MITGAMTPRLYVIPASHPCATAEAAFRVKDVDYDVTELPNVLHAPFMRARFGKRTVPALRADGEKVVGSKEIVRWVEARHPDPPLYPADPEARAEVVEAEDWGEEVLQPIGRTVVVLAIRRDLSSLPSYFAEARVPLPTPVLKAIGPVIIRMSQRLNGSYLDPAREALAALPGHLDKIDGWVEEGVLAGETANAADLQIGATLAILRTVEDVRPIIDEHRAAEIVWKFFPRYPGHVPAGALPVSAAP